MLGVALSGTVLRGFAGLMLSYDFYPVILVVQETRGSLLEFVTGLLAIIGGAYTLMSLLDRCLNRSVKSMIGKKD